MSEYWLISAPGDKTCQQTFDTLNNLTSKQNNLCNNYKFHIPDLKVGTLDQLVGLSDDLGKLDAYVEQITRKVAAYLGEVLEDQRDKLHENLLANNSPGPPPDESITIAHSELTGKSSNLSNSRDTTTTSCSACHSGGSLNNISTTDELLEREYDLLASSPACNCDECCMAVTATTTTTNAPSASATATTFVSDECYSHSSSTTLNVTQSTACAISMNASSTNPPPTAATTPIVDASTCTTTNSCYFFSTSIPSMLTTFGGGGSGGVGVGIGGRSISSRFNNNNICHINNNHNQHNNNNNNNNNRLLGFSFSNHSSCGSADNNSQHQHQHHTNHHQQQQHQLQRHYHHQPQQLQQQQQLQHNQHHHHHQHHHRHRHSVHHCDESDIGVGGVGDVCGGSGLGLGLGVGGCVSFNDAGKIAGDLKSSNSVSDVSDTFDWWFSKPRRSSKKSSSRSSSSQLNINNGFNFTSTHRSSPVSSCCGSSSQGRSSPDTDIGEQPAFPLSPAFDRHSTSSFSHIDKAIQIHYPNLFGPPVITDLSVYITRFQWDMAKYPIKQSLRNIADIISKQIGQIDADLKTKSSAYNNLKGSLQNLEKKQTGSLLTRNLADLVKKEHFILDSEYLTTLLVIVPKILANDWLANYEKITDMIVPRSSTMITQDNDYCLFNVTLFKKVVEEFKLHAREKKFIVRDFVYNEEELAAGKNEITKLITDKKKQFGPLVRWLKVNFSEAFCALIHVKALRVFVESVLRYGLPVNFQAILIEPNKKSVKRLRDCLNQLYGHLDGTSGGNQGSGVDNVDIPGLGFGQSEYFPYVYYKINIDMVETTKV